MTENNDSQSSSTPGTPQLGSSNQPLDAPDKETMEKIRLRRLAKLGILSKSSSPSEDKAEAGPSAAPPKAPTPTKSSAAIATASSSLLDNAARAAAANKVTKPAQSSAKSTSGTGLKRRFPGHGPDSFSDKPTPAPTRRVAPVVIESLEDYTDRILSDILQVTVDPEKKTSKSNDKISLTFLSGVSQELSSNNQPLKLDTMNLDSAILEAATLVPHGRTLLSYLLPAWSRAQTLKRTPTRDMTKEKLAVLDETKRMCISNCVFALTMPALFGREGDEGTNIPAQHLAHHLTLPATDDQGIDDEFLKESILRFSEVEGLGEVFAEATRVLSSSLSKMTMESPNYRNYVNTFVLFSKYPDLLRVIANHPAFLGAEDGPSLQNNTILGPFFNLSPLREESVKVFFPSPRTMDRGTISRSQESLRMTLQGLQTDLFGIVNAFVRVDSDIRSKTLNWFALAVNKNHKRRAMRYDPKEVSSDSFMVNVTRILDRLCEPFLDTTFGKIDKINADYFRQKPRVNIMDETMINADEATAKKFYSETIPGNPHFISEVFFLTLAAHHYGIEAISSKLKPMDREIKEYLKHLTLMDAERPKIASHPDMLSRFDSSYNRYTAFLDGLMGRKMTIEGVLQDQKMQETSVRFMRYVAVWLLRVGSKTDYNPEKTITLPLTSTDNPKFSCIPEYALQNVVDNFKFVYRNVPQILSFSTGPELMTLCITFLECSELIKNPYLKSSLVTLLFSGTFPFTRFGEGVLVDMLSNSEFANKNLLHALIKFYIECENTGVSSAFYDKFNIRYEIFQVIKTVWKKNDIYSRKLTQESKVNRVFFVQFVNMLLNDTTYVLDECMGKFPRIRALEKELASEEASSLNQEDRQKKEDELQQLGNSATNYMQLANETLEMMAMFTRALKSAFTMPEIVHRLASMLNYNLETLAGSKGGQLKVSSPEKYHFRPIELLSAFVDIYINLGSSSEFIEAVAADGRSYKPDVFDRAHKLLSSKSMKDPNDLAKFAAAKERFLNAKLEADQAELDLGNIPAEFEDPILGDLMKDPVILPSHNIVDRSTIVQHLLSDPKDPFTRQPMTIDDVIPQIELKERIEKWKEAKLTAAKDKIKAELTAKQEAHEVEGAETNGAVDCDAMDTT